MTPEEDDTGQCPFRHGVVSVEQLLEEGQAFEAGIVSGVENARDADKGGVRTRQVPEEDVPQEYLDED